MGYALYLGRFLKFDQNYKPQTLAYLERLCERPAFARADGFGDPLKLPGLE